MLHEQVAAVLRKGTDVKGRSRRSEFWRFTVVTAAFLPLAMLLLDVNAVLALVLLLLIACCLAFWLATAVRRLHDIGRSGAWVLLSFVPLGILVLLVWSVRDGEPGTNRWGANPKSAVTTATGGRLRDGVIPE
ncbi:DUF805 domain-containing protein [Streptomyces abyssomicinicus]|uniref:DUF805 domain-containing protein n=1 Tax=Streptomyces abyssomicinicus TaxID=574929 RepID=UPI0013E0DEA1|nr:DUF805 domain-containing protein [Streptomyces abyssomicinicus]